METQRNKHPRRRGRGALCLLVGLAVGAAVGLGGPGILQWATETLGLGKQEAQIDLTTLEESMEENNELSTAQYFYTNSVAVTDQNTLELFGQTSITMPFTEATYIFEYDGTIKAGYDLSQATVERQGDSAVVVTLPPATILSHETGDVEAVYEQENVMNPLHAGEESGWLEGQKEKMEERAISLGLFDEAQSNAETVFTALFGPALPEGCTVRLVFSDEGTDGGQETEQEEQAPAGTDQE